MILKLITLVLLGLSLNSAYATLGNDDILGTWEYDGFFYDGHRYPKPNPDLDLTFTFKKDSTSRLYWKRKDEAGFCERLANYQLKDDHLIQKTTWINPANAMSCSQDPDMQPDRESDTVITLDKVNMELSFHFDLDGKPFLYILKFKPEPGSIPALELQ